MSEFYKSTKTWSLITIAGLAFVSLFQGFSILVGLGQLLNPNAVLDLDEDGVVSVWLMLQSVVALLQFPLYILTIVAFLVWLNRSHKNLLALRPSHLNFSSGWAVGWWFIPFLALYKPFQVVREVWWESDPDIPEEQMFLTESLHSAPTYMGVWWTFWLISNFANNIAGRIFDPDRTDNVFAVGIVFIVSSVLTIIAGVLAIQVVRDVTARQAARHANVRTIESVAADSQPYSGHESTS